MMPINSHAKAQRREGAIGVLPGASHFCLGCAALALCWGSCANFCLSSGFAQKSHFVGGVSDADLAQFHTLVNVEAHYRGQRPPPQTFCAKPLSSRSTSE